MKFINAIDARNQSKVTRVAEVKKTAAWLKTSLEGAIVKAMNEGLTCATAQVPANMDGELIKAATNVLTNLGYRVKVKTELGLFGDNVYREPRVLITLFW